MADPGAGPSAPPVKDPAEAFLDAHVNDASDVSFFQCGAVDLAVRLVGQYLYFYPSRTAVRILETEAYPAGDRVYDLKIHDNNIDVKSRFKLKGGSLLSWSPTHYKIEHLDLYITAGPADTGDLVHIRSCEPILGVEEIMRRRKHPITRSIRKNLLIGPTNVSEGVGLEWQDDPLLYRYKNCSEGVELFHGMPDAATEKTKRGKRILSKTIYNGCEGTDSLYRFALVTPANYSYSTKCGGLEDWKV